MSFQERAAMEGSRPREESGSGAAMWAVGFTVFAAFMMILNGSFQVIQGLSAILEDEFFVLGRSYAFDLDVTTWGWVHFFTGIVVAMAGACLFSGALWARLVAIAVALISAIVNFFYIPYYPIWSILVIVLNVAVIWAVTAYGNEIADSA
jgi:hypothetical protein